MNNLNEKPAVGGQGEEMNNLNEKENEMNNLNDGLGLQGKYRTIVHRAATGKVETREWKVNTIHADLKAKVNDTLLSPTENFALDNLFGGNDTPPTIGDDGIIIESGTWYDMDCSSSEPTATSIKITGTITQVAGTFTDVKLGFNVSGSDDFTVTYASPTAWDNVILAEADTLTVEWTITVGA